MPRTEQRIRGPFEVFDPGNGQPKVIEPLVIVTNRDNPLQRGDRLPNFSLQVYHADTKRPRNAALSPNGGLTVLSFVNQLGTPDCDVQTAAIDRLAQENTDVTVTSISKQKTGVLNKIANQQGLSHRLASIDGFFAKRLGIELAPDQDDEGNDLADKFWYEALCRTVMLIGPDNTLLHIEQLMDQEKQPNIEALQIRINESRVA